MKSELSSILSKHIPIGKERCSIPDNFKKKGWGYPLTLNIDTRTGATLHYTGLAAEKWRGVC
jgi:hypothetical protein